MDRNEPKRRVVLTESKQTVIRPGTARDQKVIRRIVRSARLNPFRLNWSSFLVAEYEGQIVGLGQIRLHRDGTRELASLAVVPAYQRNGLGSAIVDALLNGRSGPVFLYCADRLVSYYERFGFRLVPAAALPPGMRRMYRLGQLGLQMLRKVGGVNMSLAAMCWPEPPEDDR